jgi:dihydrofolate reductase|tara:strand:- start:506 stop:1066 length:561 start_codon:yes stop_codon:yes gene_type:complete
MKCSVYIATSADGYIAMPDGAVDWLHTTGNLDADMGSEDMGWRSFINSVDCMIMGRKCMEVIAQMNLTPEQWPYGDIKIIVLSRTVATPSASFHSETEMYSGDIDELIEDLGSRGLKHAYIDGGATITSFIELGLIDEMTITQVPVLLGDGIPLFGKINRQIKLENPVVVAFPNDMVQVKYRVSSL